MPAGKPSWSEGVWVKKGWRLKRGAEQLGQVRGWDKSMVSPGLGLGSARKVSDCCRLHIGGEPPSVSLRQGALLVNLLESMERKTDYSGLLGRTEQICG